MDNPDKCISQIPSNLIHTFTVYAHQSADIVYSIKSSLYQLIQISITIQQPPNIDVNCIDQLIGALRKNIDDLKRIDSVLKGHICQQQQKKQCANEKHKKNIRRSFNNISNNDLMMGSLSRKSTQNANIQQNQYCILDLQKNRLIKEQSQLPQQSRISEQQKIENNHTESQLMMKIKQLQIENMFLRNENIQIRQNLQSINNQIASPKSMLFSFGNPNPNQDSLKQTENNAHKTEFTPNKNMSALNKQTIISKSGDNITMVWQKNRKCLALLGILKDGLKKKVKQTSTKTVSNKNRQDTVRNRHSYRKLSKQISNRVSEMGTDQQWKQQKTEETCQIINEVKSVKQ